MRIWTMLLAIALCAGPLWANGDIDPHYGVIQDETVPARKGWGDQQKTLAVLKKGDRVLVLSRLGDFYKVRLPQRLPVYVLQSKVMVGKKKAGVIATNRVNGRFGSTKGPVMTTLNKGDRVQVVGRSGKYLAVQSKAVFITAYIPMSSVQSESSPVTSLDQGLIANARGHGDDWKNRFKWLEKRLQKEMAKEVGQMRLKKFIVTCVRLENSEKSHPYLKRAVRLLRYKAMKMEKARQKYLKLTASMREKIDSHLEENR